MVNKNLKSTLLNLLSNFLCGVFDFVFHLLFVFSILTSFFFFFTKTFIQ